MPASEPAWKVWQGRGRKSRRKLTPEQISWPLTRESDEDLPEPQLPKLRRVYTEPRSEPEILHKPKPKPFSSFPEPPPSAHLKQIVISSPKHLPTPRNFGFSTSPSTAPATVTTFSDAYPTPPPSTQIPPSDLRDALLLVDYIPLSPPEPLFEPPAFKCTLVRSNARRSSNGRRRSSGKNMALDLLSPRLNGAKARQAEAAREMQKAVELHADRSGVAAPSYDFLELIGKGAFGRVYKGKNRNTNELVAIKICDIDKADYAEATQHRDETVKQLVKETSILQQLRDSSAKNVNQFYESFAFHSQLWMITEYVAGGSVRTLMRATPGGTPQKPMPLEEHFIIPIAREVAVGLKFVHDAGILHRDIKCANVMISQAGNVQLIDFGVSGLLETSFDKRSTIIGTPNWMPPEMIKDQVGAGYGTEVDCWAFGCTIFEMATGLPPDAGRNFEFLANRRQAPRLEGNQYSNGLRDFVSFILKERPYERPTVAEVLEHPYIFGTRESFPNESLSTLVKRFLDWQDRGGNRTSLWAAGGAEGLDADPSSDTSEDWVFSTTADFERDFAYEKRLSMVDPFGDVRQEEVEDASAPRGRGRKFMMHQKAMKEQQIKRGEEGLERLFNLEAPEYKYGEDPSMMQPDGPDRSSQSDLALRNWEPNEPSNRVTMIDLDAVDAGFEMTPNLDLANANTLRASRINRIMKELEDDDDEDYTYQPNRASKRATKDWKFPMMDPPAEKRATKDWKFPMMEPPPVETARRATKDWKFPVMEPPPIPEDTKTEDTPNRRTMDWTFATAEVSEDESQSDYRTSRLVQRRGTKELQLPAMAAQSGNGRGSMLPGFSFPIGAAEGSANKGSARGLGPSPPLGDAWRPPLRHAATQPIGQFDDFISSRSTPGSPERTSMIDLDFADVGLVPRPTTAASMVNSFTSSNDADITTGNPFDLEEQAQLSQNNNRASYHRQSQSEPHKQISGLLTPGDQEDEKGQGYVSDHGPIVEGREEQHRVSVGSRKSSVVRESNGSLAHRLINPKRRTRGSDAKKSEDATFSRLPGALVTAFPAEGGLNDETIKSRRQVSQTSVPSFNPESPRTWRYQDSLLSSTPPSTNGSFSSSTFASPDTALALSGDVTQLTTPRTSIATYSPRSTASFSMQLGAVQGRLRMPLRTARPTPPHPTTLDNSADQRMMVTEASRVARDHVLYLKTLRRTLKACGSQAQARRANRRPRDSSINGSLTASHSAATSVSMSSTDTSDVEGVNGTARRVLRRAESSLA
ncbi:serine threonine protein [Diplodia corticola]|uniref:non-specific serine/threonine protein kinase n=1 Tax=Diplodia corticola TaxID=236234 RepID=A0A1J9RLS9_9PEZI|nr:serine threonine protein [Diplodia corticola]OJD29463.1 serine threonine protein [Diplodia corticola]